MSNNDINCPICKKYNLKREAVDENKGIYRFACPACGHYKITFEAEEDIESLRSGFSAEDFNFFSGYLRNFSTKDNPILINSSTLKRIGEIIAPYKRLTVPEKINNLVRFIYGNAKNPYERIVIPHSE